MNKAAIRKGSLDALKVFAAYYGSGTFVHEYPWADGLCQFTEDRHARAACPDVQPFPCEKNSLKGLFFPKQVGHCSQKTMLSPFGLLQEALPFCHGLGHKEIHLRQTIHLRMLAEHRAD